MKPALGVALYALAAFLCLGVPILAGMSRAAPEGHARAILRAAFTIGVLIIAVLVAAGWELL